MYSEKFEKAFDYVTSNEGGYIDDPQDPGGATKYGISQRSYPNVDIKNLTLEKAKEIYHRDFWLRGKYEEITDAIAIKLFDLSVNVGITQANRLIQRALRSVEGEVTEDGIIGPITLTAINKSPSRELLAALKSEAAGYYRMIVQSNRTQQKFLNGWLNRSYKTVLV